MNFPAGTSVPSFLQSLHHCMSYKDAHENLISCKVKRDVFHDKMFRVPTLLLIKKFQDFPGHLTMLFHDCHSPATFKYKNKQQLLTPYIQIDSTVHRGMVITEIFLSSLSLCFSKQEPKLSTMHAD